MDVGMTLDDSLKLIAELQKEVVELRAENRRLHRRIEELEQLATRQAAPFRRTEQSKIPPAEQKRPGRKPGHPGAYRQIPEHVDEEIEVPLERCPHCQGPVEERMFVRQYIEELPPVRPHVVRLITWQGKCQQCGDIRSTHPLQTSTAQGAAGVQLGPRALAAAALLNKHLGLTVGKTCAVFRRLFGCQISRGGLTQALARVADKVQGSYEQLVDQIRKSRAVFADETSWWVGGPSWWLWTFTTSDQTLYCVERSRSAQVVEQTLGETFGGMLISDCLVSYDPIHCRKHKCIAHHLKAIKQARDRPDTKDPRYLDQWRLFFKAVLGIAHARSQMEEADFIERRQHLEAWCDRLFEQPCEQAGDVAVRNRLAKRREHLLGCLYEPAAEPTNNRAERALRPAVIARKLSCGNKTIRGKRTFEILASLAATCQQRGADFLSYLAPQLSITPAPAG
jgi:transposase